MLDCWHCTSLTAPFNCTMSACRHFLSCVFVVIVICFIVLCGIIVQRALVDQMKSKAKEGTLKTVNGAVNSQPPAKRRRWDVSSVGPADETPLKQSKPSWDEVEANTPSQSRWDDTPGRAKGADTPGATPGASTRQWDQTPGHASSGAATPGRETPGQQVTPSARRNRWDETPKTDRGFWFTTFFEIV